MTPLILKHARKDRLGAIDRARTTSMTTNRAVSVGYFWRRRHKGARGSGQSLLARIRRRHTIAGIQQHVSSRWWISRLWPGERSPPQI
jgi:hypothetical protein